LWLALVKGDSSDVARAMRRCRRLPNGTAKKMHSLRIR
jgi:hypothetical protein